MPENPKPPTVEIADVTITDGIGVPFGSGRSGGGIFNWNATLTLTDVVITANSVGQTLGRQGGGLYNVGGVVTLNSCLVTDNEAYVGGGIDNASQGKLTLEQTVVSANHATYGAGIGNNGTTTLNRSEVSQNLANSTGGGIGNIGFLTLIESTVAANQAKGGAGIETANGQVVVQDSTIADNLSPGVSGGGMFHQGGSVWITRSTLSGNSGYLGGAIFSASGDLRISDSTISGNTAEFAGGGIFAAAGSPTEATFVELAGSTITQNVARGNDLSSGGGGVKVASNPSGSARFLPRSSLIAENRATASGPDVRGPAISLGYNLIGNSSDSTGWLGNDQVGTAAIPIDPRLGPLKDNGGPTLTHAVLIGSPALRKGDPALEFSFDQRYTERAFVTAPDVGAFHSQPAVRFELLAPPQVIAGIPFSLTVIAIDGWDNTASTYAGTIHFGSTDAGAQLPPNYSFTAVDGGEHTFNVTLQTPGRQTILVNDTTNPARKGRVGVEVLSASRGYRDSDVTDRATRRPFIRGQFPAYHTDISLDADVAKLFDLRNSNHGVE